MGAAVSGDASRRRQLQALYVASIAADGMAAVHRLLSAAIIEARKPAKRANAKRKPAPKPATMQFQGSQIVLGPAMQKLTELRRLFVLHHVNGGLSMREAARAAGYCGGNPTKSLRHCPRVAEAIAEMQKA